MGFSWRKTFKIKQTRKSKCLSAFDVEHAQCLTGYHVFMVSGLDLARAPRRARLTARKKGSGYENGIIPEPSFPSQGSQARGTRLAQYGRSECCRHNKASLHELQQQKLQ